MMVVVLYVHNENTEKLSRPHSECIILNAQDISSGPVARIILPDRIPYGATPCGAQNYQILV